MRGHWWLSAVAFVVADVVGGKSDETESVVSRFNANEGVNVVNLMVQLLPLVILSGQD